jgi:UDP-N-acetylmuramate dehydrogenase
MEFGKNVSLKQFSRINIGGPARDFIRVDTIEDLFEAVKTSKELGMRIFILGAGTNILWSDDGFSGVVIQPAFDYIKFEGDYVISGSGVNMQKLVSATISRGLSGLDWAGGLPGSFGGAIFGNAGCYGGEIKDSVVEVVSFDINNMGIKRRSNKECGFGYRTSLFKINENKEVIIQATLKLAPSDKRHLYERVSAQIAYREHYHPLEYPNLGSIFKNVAIARLPSEIISQHKEMIKNDPFPVIPAGYLIDKAGLGGTRVGDAVVSLKRPIFIVNIGNATSDDVLSLIDIVKRKVYEKFKIQLEEEIRIVK